MQRIDANDDTKISLGEFLSNGQKLFDDLGLEDLDVDEEQFRSMADAQEGGEYVTFASLCRWYLEAASGTEDDLEEQLADWVPEEPPPALKPLVLDAAVFTDLVLVAHYITRA